MKVALSRLLPLPVLTIALGLVSSDALATAPQNSDKSVAVIISQGSGTCNSYAIANIQSLGGSVSTAGGTFSSNGASASYKLIKGGTELQFSGSTVPINFAIIKSSQDVRIFYYPTPTYVNADKKLTFGNTKKIDSVSLCYGQGGGATAPPPEPVAIPTCADLVDSGLLDASAVTCPTDFTEERVIFSVDPSKPLWNPVACTCNVPPEEAFEECDANATADDDPTQTRACFSGNGLRGVVTVIELINDGTGFCTTIGGTRTCYK
jgi:hypothetical protein